MKTKIVYALVSSEKDIYLEQAWLSIYSLRLYNPYAEIIVMTDDSTEKTLTGNRAKIKKLVNEIKVIDVPPSYSPKERSRYIKTSIRQNMTGSFLFIDTDTIITAPLDNIDNLESDIAIVPDFHGTFKNYPFRSYIIQLMHELFRLDVSDVPLYYNSGTVYAKDTPFVHSFFEKWNRNWTYSAFMKGNSQDQPALMKTDKEMGYPVQELSGVYNCQIAASVRHLCEAKIIHFFNARFLKETNYSPFFQREFYLNIRKSGEITPQTEQMVRTCKSQFDVYSTIVGQREFIFLTSSIGHRLMDIAEKKGVCFHLLDFFLKIRQRFIRNR